MRTIPIRWKFTLWTVALVGVAVLIFSGGAFANFYNEELEAIDAQIQADESLLTQLSSRQGTTEMVDATMRDRPSLAYARFDPEGRLAKISAGLPLELARKARSVTGLHTFRSTAGVWRLAAFPHGRSQLVVASNLGELEDTFREVLLAFALSFPVVLVIAAGGAWWVAGRALEPIRKLTAAAKRIDADQLNQRVPVTSANDEIDRLATVFNAMLVRLETSFGQTRRFAADASHELRTPLTIMRGEITHLLREPGLLPSHEARLLSLQEEIDRLERVTESLLLLTHLDVGNFVLERKPVDLSALVADVCEDAEWLGSSRQVKVELAVAENVTVLGDAAQLRRILLILLDNATKFNFPGGIARCALVREKNRAMFRIGNGGPGIPAELRPQVFQRFFRAGPSRPGERPGHGLGLSLGREIARAHGGDLCLVDSSDPGWTEFVLTLPF